MISAKPANARTGRPRLSWWHSHSSLREAASDPHELHRKAQAARDAEIEAAERIAGDELRLYGYDVDHPS